MSGFMRTVTNNLVVLGLALVLIAFAAINWVGGAIFEDRYEIVVPMRDAGGLFPLQETTVLGHGIGQIRDLRLTPGGVDVVLEVRGDEHVPERAVVQVLRRSTIGEQALNFIPVPADWEPPDDPETIEPASLPVTAGWEPADRGATVDPVAVVLPPEIPAVLEAATDLFRELPADDVGTVVHELATALDGRSDLLRELNRDVFDLNSTLVGGIPEFERLIDSSAPVLEELNEHRVALADSFSHLADVSDVLAENRPTLDRIVDEGTPFLRRFDAFVTNTRENQSCLFDDFLDLNRTIAQPENLRNLAEGLDLHEAFYFGADNVIQFDPVLEGVPWFRVNLLLFEEATARSYEPRRPTPPTLPGAACVSPWGLGVNAVRQPGHQPPDPTSPGIDFAPVLEEDDVAAPREGGPGEEGEGTSGSDRRTVARGAAAPDAETPRTGGGITLLAPLAAGAAWLLRRTR